MNIVPTFAIDDGPVLLPVDNRGTPIFFHECKCVACGKGFRLLSTEELNIGLVRCNVCGKRGSCTRLYHPLPERN